MLLLFRVQYRDGVMEHEPKACAAVKGTQIMVCFGTFTLSYAILLMTN